MKRLNIREKAHAILVLLLASSMSLLALTINFSGQAAPPPVRALPSSVTTPSSQGRAEVSYRQPESTTPHSSTTALASAQGATQADRELAALIRRLTNRSIEGLVEEKLPDGSSSIDLQGRFQNVALAKVKPDGTLSVGCVESLEQANAFFGRDLETGQPHPAPWPEPDEAAIEAARHGISPEELQFLQNLIAEAAQRRALSPTAATITIVNGDGPGEGFNDPTPRLPEGGNAGVTLGQQRLNLFQQAASIWGAFLDSSVPIQVYSQFNSMAPCGGGSGTVGRAGPTTSRVNFTNAEVANTQYPIALANKQAGSDLNGGQAEITAEFNSDVDNGCIFPGTRFYYGFDNNPPGGAIPCLLVLLHELGHGLGFLTFFDSTTGAFLNSYPDIFSRHIFDRSVGKLWDQMSNAERLTSALNTHNVLWDGPNVRIASDFLTAGREAATGRVQLFTPSPYQGGSSISHWDSDCSPDLLMKPSNGGFSLDLDLTRQVMRDIGWYRDTTADLVPDTITNVQPNSGSVAAGSAVNITWTNNGGFNRNVTIELSTDGGASFPIAVATDVANTGTFAWTVPNNATTQARLRVREHNFVAPAGVSSADFTITGGGNCTGTDLNPIGQQTVFGSLGAGDCRLGVRGNSYYCDLYSFVYIGLPVTISLSSTAFDTYLNVRCQSLVPPFISYGFEDDDGGPGTNSRFPPDSGFFVLPYDGQPWMITIEVTSYQPNATGNYWLTVSRPFQDVAGASPFYDAINRLAASGITAGCDVVNFCPDASVTRAQMAVFLERGIHGAAFEPPLYFCTHGHTPNFDDVACPNFFAGFIESLSSDGITAGCGARLYCPSSPVTRAQMAIFLLKAKHGSGYTPPPATGTRFLDVQTTTFGAAWIEQLAAEGITSGCGGGNYCPGMAVTRGQMALFLVRTFNL